MYDFFTVDVENYAFGNPMIIGRGQCSRRLFSLHTPYVHTMYNYQLCLCRLFSYPYFVVIYVYTVITATARTSSPPRPSRRESTNVYVCLKQNKKNKNYNNFTRSYCLRLNDTKSIARDSEFDEKHLSGRLSFIDRAALSLY